MVEEIILLRLVNGNRLVNLGISKQQPLVFGNKEFNFRNTNLTQSKRLRYVT